MNTFELWPAIDLMSGKPVRLFQGDFGQKVEYDDKVTDLAQRFSKFATGIHVVDLDGARKGKPQNLKVIKKIIEASDVPVEVGGGIRTLAAAEDLFGIGVSRIILGTVAVKNPDFLAELMEIYGPDKVVVGVDVEGDQVAISGWEESTNLHVDTFVTDLTKKYGVQTIIFTDISTDGTLTGPPVARFRDLAARFPDLNIIASGGVANIDDLHDLQSTGVLGSVFGKAYYEERISDEQLIAFSKE